MHELETVICWLAGAGVLVGFGVWVVRAIRNCPRL
jgi:hypothetical protein